MPNLLFHTRMYTYLTFILHNLYDVFIYLTINMEHTILLYIT